MSYVSNLEPNDEFIMDNLGDLNFKDLFVSDIAFFNFYHEYLYSCLDY